MSNNGKALLVAAIAGQVVIVRTLVEPTDKVVRHALVHAQNAA